MLDLLDDGELEQAADRVLAATQKPGAVVFVSGTPGAGRSRLIARLRARASDLFRVVDPPSAKHADTAMHALMQMAAAVGVDGIDDALANQPLSNRARTIGRALADQHRVLLLRLPPTWLKSTARGSDEAIFQRCAFEYFRGLRGAKSLRLVILSSWIPIWLQRKLAERSPETVALPPATLRPDAEPDPAVWADYADAAARVFSRLTSTRITAFQFGLAVALEKLDPRLALSAEQLDSRGALDRLLVQLRTALAGSRYTALRSGLARVAQARYPISPELALQIADVEPEHQALVLRCVGYVSPDGATFRMNDTIRAALLSIGTSDSPRDFTDTHAKLAGYFETKDGVADPRKATNDGMLPWLEATHHFAWAGERGRDKWHDRAQACHSREFFWDRARALSIQERRYLDAAEVYRQCVEAFDDDHYAWHYYAWNLDKAGKRPRDVEAGFRRAVDLEGENNWYNSRLITFLIGIGRYDDAEEAWREFLDCVDPDRTRSLDDEDLGWGFHRWVVERWLDAGEVERARAALEVLSADLIQRVPPLGDLAWRLADAEESKALGESVYPPGVHPDERWKQPGDIPIEIDGRSLRSWHPARVVSVDDDAIEIVIADPRPEPRNSELKSLALSRDEWKQLTAGEPPPPECSYWFLARYERGFDRLFRHRATPPPWERASRDRVDALRYLRTWAEVA